MDSARFAEHIFLQLALVAFKIQVNGIHDMLQQFGVAGNHSLLRHVRVPPTYNYEADVTT